MLPSLSLTKVFSSQNLRTKLALLLASVIASIGLAENSTAIVIGSMAISPLIAMLLQTMKDNSIKGWSNFIFWLLIPIVVGIVSQTIKVKLFDPYILGRKVEHDDPEELLKRTGKWKDIIIISSVLGFFCGVLLKLFPTDHVTLAGISIAISLTPPLVASGMFMSNYAIFRKKDTVHNITSALLLFLFNILSLALGYKIS